jgi:hypothetical protein
MKRLLMIVTIIALAFIVSAHSHSWYPPACCHDMDCHPVDDIKVLPDGGFEVKSNGQTILVPENFPRQRSQDGNYHICFRDWGAAGEQVLIHCFFEPGNM